MMKEQKNKLMTNIAIFFAIIISLSLSACQSKEDMLRNTIRETREFLIAEKDMLNIDSSGTWLLIGLLKDGEFNNKKELEELKESYLLDLKAKLNGGKGILDDEYYTIYERISIALSMMEKNPKDIYGYDIFSYIDDYEKVEAQGLNAVAFALISSNVAGIRLENEERYLKSLISGIENKELYKDEKSTDYVMMALQALSSYKDRDDVRVVIDSWLKELEKHQKDDGSFGNCESTAEMIIALNSLGKSLDGNFVNKNGKNLYDGLMVYRYERGFKHTLEENDVNIFATEKGYLALISIKLNSENKKLYHGK